MIALKEALVNKSNIKNIRKICYLIFPFGNDENTIKDKIDFEKHKIVKNGYTFYYISQNIYKNIDTDFEDEDTRIQKCGIYTADDIRKFPSSNWYEYLVDILDKKLERVK